MHALIWLIIFLLILIWFIIGVKICYSPVKKGRVDDIGEVPAADVQPIDRWISVKDRLPDDCVEVLAYDTDCGVVIGWYDKEIGDFAADFISPLDAVTHWQPLPEKPQD